jgi:hypothetical protein
MNEPTALKLRNKKSEAKDFNPPPLTIRSKTILGDIQSKCVAPTPLSIKSKEFVDNSPKSLSIVSSESKMTRQDNMKFDLSIEYIRAKIPGFTTFMYSQIRPILDNLERINVNNQNTDILDLGKFLQETIATKSLEINRINGQDLIAEIQVSHNMIVECVEMNVKKSFICSITDTLFGKTIKHEDIQVIISDEMSKNKSYRSQISELMQKYPRYEDQLIKLRAEMMMYIEVSKLLIAEFEAAGFMANIDLINRRIISLMNSNTVLETSLVMLKMQKDKLIILGNNIDEVINVLVPTLLSKLTMENFNDSSFRELSNIIIAKLS